MKKLCSLLLVIFTCVAVLAEKTEAKKFKNGVPVYPVPMLGVTKTPFKIKILDKVSDAQIAHMGYRGGFSGFIDKATGKFAYPGYNNFVNLQLGFDDDGFLAIVTMPPPYGRKTRSEVNSQSEDLLQDDVVELLIEPRDREGKSKGIIYRVLGNANGVFLADYDDPNVGLYHQSWQNHVIYRVNQTYGGLSSRRKKIWQAVIYIPFEEMGRKPENGDVWGVQCALRYVDPKVTAILSPTEKFEDVNRFAQLRFDLETGADFRLSWMEEGALNQGKYSSSALYSNCSSNPVEVDLSVECFKGQEKTGEGVFKNTVPPQKTYFPYFKRFSVKSQKPFDEKKDSYYLVQAWDKKRNKLIYKQYIPCWKPAKDERAWLDQHFAKEFTFLTGAYPSKNAIDFSVDCQSLMEKNPEAEQLVVSVSRDGKTVKTEKFNLKASKGKIAETIELGEKSSSMPKGKYQLTASIRTANGKEISSKQDSFTRKKFAFETAPKAGLSDIIVAPFTEPEIKKTSIASCWNREYQHGSNGLFTSLIADGKDILAGPVKFIAKTADGKKIALTGGKVSLEKQGKGKITFKQEFTGAGLKLKVNGIMDYDGFYRFKVDYAPESAKIKVDELLIEVPLKQEYAFLHDQAIAGSPSWRDLKPEDIYVGNLPKKQGRLWDSQKGKKFCCNWRILHGSMANYIWIGDDHRGLTWSMESDQGTHNDDELPAATLDREGDKVVFRDWLVNKPFELDKERSVEFAFQATPFKPMPENWRLWREQPKPVPGGREDILRHPYKNGLAIGCPWEYWGIYHPYGRFLTLDYFKEGHDKMRKNGWEITSVAASSCSEGGGTPEYQGFWHEWGSPLGWNKQKTNPVPERFKKLHEKLGLECNRFIGVEAGSNSTESNIDYRIWWFNELVKNCGLKTIYQDNPPHHFYYQPKSGFGYTREDGVKQATSNIWQARKFMKRVAHTLAENGVKITPNVYANMCSTAIPGRSFSRRVLYGELSTPNVSLDAMRVWFSKQWGFQMHWLLQTPHPGAERDWRELFSKIQLLDVTDFARENSYSKLWLMLLDLFWLDDPSLKWLPYYDNPLLASTKSPDTKVSIYTKNGKTMLVVSNQSDKPIVEEIKLKDLDKYCDATIKYFYDAESLEVINAENQNLKLFVGPKDCRIVLGFPKPWKYAAKNRFKKEFPVQSELNYRKTITDIAKQLLKKPELSPVENGHKLTEFWIAEVIKEAKEKPELFKYYDENQCKELLEDKEVECSALVKYTSAKRKNVAFILAAYYNPTKYNKLLNNDLAKRFCSKLCAQKLRYIYILDPIRGISPPGFNIDIPAKSGRIEFYYWNYKDYGKKNAGPCKIGTAYSIIKEAVTEEIKKHNEK